MDILSDFMTPLPPACARAAELTLCAHQLLLGQLTKHGNHISDTHSAALWQLLTGFTEQALGIWQGRRAYALPCGTGKTTAVVAWIAAQIKLGLRLSIAVTAQQVESLAKIKDQLVELGVPEQYIGIRHSRGGSVSWPDTGDSDRLIMLGTHARVHGCAELPPFCLYRGEARDLLIWDESLISSDAQTIDTNMTRTALGHFVNGARPLLAPVLDRFERALADERQSQASGRPPNILTLLTVEEAGAALDQLGSPYCTTIRESDLLKDAQEAIRLFQHPTSFVEARAGETGRAFMQYRIIVAAELRNVAVLDASYAVRELCKADRTIVDCTTNAMRDCKDYSRVTLKFSPVPTGKCQFRRRKLEDNAAVAAAVDVILNIPLNESVLVFTFKDEAIQSRLRIALRDARRDPNAMMPCGRRPRIEFNTWGRHTTDNSYSDRQHVVLVGVLRRSPLDLTASMAGQRDDLRHRMTRQELLQTELSELTSNVLQAANRGCCRKVDGDGRAHAMTIHLLTKEASLRPLLEGAMPGLQWETIQVREPTDTELLGRQIMDHLVNSPMEVTRLSKQALFSAIDCRMGKDAKAEAMKSAMWELGALATKEPQHGWFEDGRSLARRAAV